MPALMIDGVPIAELDAESAERLTNLSRRTPGKVLNPINIVVGAPPKKLEPQSTGFFQQVRDTVDATITLRFHPTRQAIAGNWRTK